MTTVVAALALGAAAPAWGAPGDVWLGDSNNGDIFRVPAGSSGVQPVSSDPQFISPNSLEFAPDGRLFVLDYGAFGGTGGLFVLDPSTGQATPFAGGAPFQQPDGMALSLDGGLYVTDLQALTIFRVDLSTAAVRPVSSGALLAGGPLGIVVEPPTGRILVTDGTNNQVIAVDPKTGVQSIFSSGDSAFASSELAGLTRLPDGTLGAADYNDGNIFRIDGTSGVETRIAQDQAVVDGGYDITHDLDGNLIVAAGNNAEQGALRVDSQSGAKSAAALRIPGTYIEGVMVEPPTCNGKLATIVGTSKSETINASPLDDVVAGLAGDDLINGLGGAGLVCAGTGNDKAVGGDAADQLLGEDGKDTLNGGKGKDKLVGGKGKDKLVGGKGKDKLVGGPGKDTLNCGKGKGDIAVADTKDKVKPSCEKVK